MQAFFGQCMLCDKNNQPSLISSLSRQNYKETPLKIQVLETLGLKGFLIENLIFIGKSSTYKIKYENENKNREMSQSSSSSLEKNRFQFDFTKHPMQYLNGYTQICDIIDTNDHFIPIIHFKQANKQKSTQQLSPPSSSKAQQNVSQASQASQIISESESCLFQSSSQQSTLTVIYSHGNAANLQDTYSIAKSIIKKYRVNVIVYDYTGYANQLIDQWHQQQEYMLKKNGERKGKPFETSTPWGKSAPAFYPNTHRISDKSICQDLLEVIKWSGLSHSQIVLWGFSLGCHPTISASTHYQVNSMILQSPFSSIYSLFQSSQMSNDRRPFRHDIFNNYKLITKSKAASTIIFHSSNDQIIPFRQSQILMEKCDNSIDFDRQIKLIQVNKLGHNQMHSFFVCRKENVLQKQMSEFFTEAMNKLLLQNKKDQNLYVSERQKSQNVDNSSNSRQLSNTFRSSFGGTSRQHINSCGGEASQNSQKSQKRQQNLKMSSRTIEIQAEDYSVESTQNIKTQRFSKENQQSLMNKKCQLKQFQQLSSKKQRNSKIKQKLEQQVKFKSNNSTERLVGHVENPQEVKAENKKKQSMGYSVHQIRQFEQYSENKEDQQTAQEQKITNSEKQVTFTPGMQAVQ